MIVMDLLCHRFETKLAVIMEHFHSVFKAIPSRIRAEQFKVLRCMLLHLRYFLPFALVTCDVIRSHFVAAIVTY